MYLIIIIHSCLQCKKEKTVVRPIPRGRRTAKKGAPSESGEAFLCEVKTFKVASKLEKDLLQKTSDTLPSIF